MPNATPKFQLVGGTYQGESLNLDAQRCVNLYPSSDQSKGGRNIGALLGTPGITLLLTLPHSPIRCITAGQQRLFVIAGAILYEVFVGVCSTNGTAITWVSGYSDFVYMQGVAGATPVIEIGASSYNVSAVATNGLSATLASSAGVQTDVGFVGYYPRGNVGNDGNPAQMIPTGSQLAIASAGDLYVDTGGGPVQISYANGSGNVTTSGTAVTSISGDKFDSSNLLGPMVINGTSYAVSSVNSPTSITLSTSAGTQSDTYTGTCDTSGTGVSWDSGSTFDIALAAQVAALEQIGQTVTMTINGTAYSISSVNSTTSITLTGSAGTQSAVAFTIELGVAYTASYPVTVATMTYLDGYVIVNPPSTSQINISAYGDGTSFNPLDFALKAGYPDNLVAIMADHEELWLFGSQTTELWQDTGNAQFPLQRNPGAFMPLGCAASASPVRLGTGAAQCVGWLGGDTRVRARAYLAQGFQPTPVSTPAIEAAWRGYSKISDAVSWTYAEDSHDFWVIDFPTGNATWVYDLTEGMWHERAYNASVSYPSGALVTSRQLQSFHAFILDQHIVGDYSSGNLYVQSLTTYTDASTEILRVRAASDISQPDLDWMFYSRFRLDAENSGALDPTLDWSVDGGHTFGNPAADPAASVGDEVYSFWEWRRLGRSRPRTFRIYTTAAVKVALINGSVDSHPGRPRTR